MTSMPAGNGLTCYTANLLGYLERHCDDAAARVARSVRLAVRVAGDGPCAFSHHGIPLDRLGGGRRLVYRAAGDVDAALEGVGAEVAAHGHALVVANSAALPWAGGRAPHFLLIDGHDESAGRWHAVDRFTALVGELDQSPFAGWIGTEVLAGALDCPSAGTHLLRNEHAFGFPVPVPAGSFRWLAQAGGEPGPPPPVLAAGWIAGTAALDHLRAIALDETYLDDVWAAARHHVFRHTHPATAGAGSTAAAAAWEALPMTLRFAVDSARRGRPRPSLVTAAFDRLLRIETEAEK